MKEMISLIFTFLLLQGSSAQQITENTFRKNETGVIILKVINGPYFILFDGARYKRHFGKNALRAGFEYFRNNYKSEAWHHFYYYRETGFSTGFQRSLINKKSIDTYLAFDFKFMSTHNKSETDDDFSGGYTNKDLEYSGFGFAPVIGLKVKIYKGFSFHIESNYELILGKKRGIIIENEELSGPVVTTLVSESQFLKRMVFTRFSLDFAF